MYMSESGARASLFLCCPEEAVELFILPVGNPRADLAGLWFRLSLVWGIACDGRANKILFAAAIVASPLAIVVRLASP